MKVKTSIVVEQKLWRKLKHLAIELERSVSDLLEEGIRYLVKKYARDLSK